MAKLKNIHKIDDINCLKENFSYIENKLTGKNLSYF